MKKPPRARASSRLALAALVLALPAIVTLETNTSMASAVAQVKTPSHPYRATITITKHGIPHVTANSYPNVAYGAGWSTAAEATCTLMDMILTARGQRSLRYGPDAVYSDRVGSFGTNLQWDTLVTDLHNRDVVEDLLNDPVAGPSARAKAMVSGEAAGINEWLSSHEIADPACADQGWIQPDVTATDIWYALYLSQLIGSTTNFLGQITSATPPTAASPAAAAAPTRAQVLHRLGRDGQDGFGSNATAVGGSDTTTGRGMLLGNPHFPWLGRYRFTQIHLTIPGKFNVAGGALIGFPTVNIGFNNDVAWSHTVSTAYRFTPYEYETAGTPTSYQTDNGMAELERRDVDVQVLTDSGVQTVNKTLWRTPQGYVFSAPNLFMGWTTSSFWAMRDANAEHLRTLDTFLSMARAHSVRDLLQREDEGAGMPWVNTIAADRAGDVVYADHSVVPRVTDRFADKCMTAVGRVLFNFAGLPGLDGTRANSECKWGTDKDAQRPGILGPRHLPSVITDRWVMNANDSYWAPNSWTRLTGFPRIVGCEACERSMRTKVVMSYVRNQLRRGKESPETLRSHEYANRVYAAEVARAGGRLDEVCAATGETDACQVLHDWDGRSNVDSVGTAIFSEFIIQAFKSGTNLWAVPFDPAHPFTTPRKLSTDQPAVDAMSSAIDRLRVLGVDLHAPYGSMHYSGDRGDEGLYIPLSGGLSGNTGDANTTYVREGDDLIVGAVDEGSSYIQAIAFVGSHKVIARSVLTYGQYEDPASPWSNDQTYRFSRKGWLRFPWTQAQIEDATVETIHLN